MIHSICPQGNANFKKWDNHYMLIRMFKIQNPEKTKCWQGWGAIGTLIHCSRKCKMAQLLWETIWWFLKKKLDLPWLYSPAVVHLGVCPKEWKLISTQYLHTDIYSSLFTAKTWKQQRCPSVGNWISTLLHPDKGLLFFTRKKGAVKLWKDMEEY